MSHTHKTHNMNTPEHASIQEVRFDPKYSKHYATRENALKAVEKAASKVIDPRLTARFMIHPVEVDGNIRYLPIFVGANCINGFLGQGFAIVN